MIEADKKETIIVGYAFLEDESEEERAALQRRLEKTFGTEHLLYLAGDKEDVENAKKAGKSLGIYLAEQILTGEDFNKVVNEVTEEEILEALKPNYIDGLSLLGGEPFEPENQEVLVKLLRKVKERYPEKNIWCYSGYLFDEELKKESRARCEYTDEMLSMLDVLVDGRFEEDKKNITLLFRGSENQRLIDVKKSLEQDKVVEWKPAIKRGL